MVKVYAFTFFAFGIEMYFSKYEIAASLLPPFCEELAAIRYAFALLAL